MLELIANSGPTLTNAHMKNRKAKGVQHIFGQTSSLMHIYWWPQFLFDLPLSFHLIRETLSRGRGALSRQIPCFIQKMAIFIAFVIKFV